MIERIPFRENWGERIVAFVLLIISLPILIEIALVVQFLGGTPVLVRDEYARGGSVRRNLRFRTTGSGTETFRWTGRYLRVWRLDELPALWNVVRGEVRLFDVLVFDNFR
jgi:lipopolysaccharide/colanic/teichoic acid biosynthesis glycosyltransferase